LDQLTNDVQTALREEHGVAEEGVAMVREIVEFAFVRGQRCALEDMLARKQERTR
jgi:hypothetical protein